MTRRIAAAAVLIVLGVAGEAVAAAPQRPNLIWIMADDLGYGELGCYGQQVIRTPRVDRMAREGMRFTQFYAGATVCAPSRSVLMTGQHHGHTRVRGNAGPHNPLAQALRADDVTIAEVLQQAGYATALLGKWGLGDVGAAECGLPRRQGFDEFFGYLNQRHAHNHFPDFLWRNEQRLALPNTIVATGGDGSGYATDAVLYADDLIADEVLKFVARHQDKPFFVYWNPVIPHANNERSGALGDGAEVPDFGPYARENWPAPDKGHAAMVTRLDGYVGRLLDQLHLLGLAEKTLVVFTSDNGPHGESRHDLNRFRPAGPLRGQKRSLTEGGIRVPMIAWWPGSIAAGSESAHVGYFGDWFATAAELAGAELPKETPLDSISFVPALLGREAEQKRHEYLYWEFHERGFIQAVLYQGRWKAIREWSPSAPLRLYDLQSDLGERRDLAAEQPELVAKLDAYLRTARSESPDWPIQQPAGAPPNSPPQSPPRVSPEASARGSQATGAPPNILLILTDDQSFETLGALGRLDIRTPNLDRLASLGTTFTHAYNMGSWTGAVCIASRTMLVTGRSVWRAEAFYRRTDAEREAGRLWPQLMARAGYRTYFTGKWHINTDAAKAFDAVGHIRAGMPKDSAQYNRPAPDGTDTWDPADPRFGGHWEGGRHWSEVTADEAIDYLRQAEGEPRPVFMYVAFNAPHDPRQSPQRFLDMYPFDRIAVPRNFLPEYPYQDAIGCSPDLRDERLAPFPRTEHAVRVHRREYYAMISHLDEQIGRILDALERSGRKDRTWVFLTSDQGLAVGRHGLFGKQNMYEHSLRVPLVVVGPGVGKGRCIDVPVYLQDIMPTALELAGLEKPDWVEFHSLLPLLRSARPKPADPAIYAAYLGLQRAVIEDGWKLIVYPQAGVKRLYHVAEDPDEMHDVAGDLAQAERIERLTARLKELQRRYGDELNLDAPTPTQAATQ